MKVEKGGDNSTVCNNTLKCHLSIFKYLNFVDKQEINIEEQADRSEKGYMLYGQQKLQFGC